MFSRRRRYFCLALLLGAGPARSQTAGPLEDLPRFVRLESDALEKSALERAHPALPPAAGIPGWSAAAVVEVLVDERGTVRSAKPVDVHPRLRARAHAAARRWTFAPPRRDGSPVRAVGRITLEFTPAASAPDPPELERARAAAEQDPSDPALQYALGKRYHDSERDEEAVEALRRSLKLKPDSEEACVLLGASCRRMQSLGEEASAYADFLRLKPESAAVLELLARSYLEQHRYPEAIPVLERLDKLRLVDASVVLQLGQAHARVGQFEDAVRVYGRALELHPDNAELRANLGQELVRVGRFREAEPELSRALQLDPRLQLAYHGLGDAYLFTGRAAKALDVYRTCVKTTHGDLQGLETDYHRLGAASGQLRQFENAEHLLEQALVLEPGFAEAYCDLARTYVVEKRDERAVEVLHKGLAVRPDVPCVYGFLGTALLNLERLDEAENALQQLIAIAPEAPFGYVKLAEVQIRAEKWDAAHAALRRARELAPSDVHVPLVLGLLYSSTDRPAESERELRAALRLEPTNPMVLNNLAYQLAEQGKDLAEALRLIERAVAAEPQNGAYVDTLGWIHFKLGRLDLAEKYVKQSLELGRDSAEVVEHLGDIYSKQGKTEAAEQKWREAQSLRPDRRQLARLREKLGARDR